MIKSRIKRRSAEHDEPSAVIMGSLFRGVNEVFFYQSRKCLTKSVLRNCSATGCEKNNSHSKNKAITFNTKTSVMSFRTGVRKKKRRNDCLLMFKHALIRELSILNQIFPGKIRAPIVLVFRRQYCDGEIIQP